MLRFRALILLSVLLVPTVQAYDITVVNEATQPVTALSVFPIGEDGQPIEDNLGGFFDALPQHQKKVSSINADCGPTLAVVVMEDGSELRGQLDTCKQTVIRVGE